MLKDKEASTWKESIFWWTDPRCSWTDMRESDCQQRALNTNLDFADIRTKVTTTKWTCPKPKTDCSKGGVIGGKNPTFSQNLASACCSEPHACCSVERNIWPSQVASLSLSYSVHWLQGTTAVPALYPATEPWGEGLFPLLPNGGSKIRAFHLRPR